MKTQPTVDQYALPHFLQMVRLAIESTSQCQKDYQTSARTREDRSRCTVVMVINTHVCREIRRVLRKMLKQNEGKDIGDMDGVESLSALLEIHATTAMDIIKLYQKDAPLSDEDLARAELNAGTDIEESEHRNN